MTPEQRLAALINCKTPEQATASGFPVATIDYALAEIHGVLALLDSNLSSFQRLHHSDLITDQSMINRLKRYSHHCVASEMQHRVEFTETLELIQQYNPILLKGVVMAYVYYPDPQLRPMVDVDLLVPKDALTSIKNILLNNGFILLNNAFSNSVLAQISCIKRLGQGNSLHLDIHTNMFNRANMQKLLPYELLFDSAQKISVLGPHALAPSPVLCLIHASLHIVQHHNDQRLIWLYDIKLLVESFTEADTEQLLDYCDTRRIAKTILTIIDNCHDKFPLEADDLREKLAIQSKSQEPNPHPVTALLADHSHLAILALDWKSIKGIKNRLTWLKEHLFPDRQYIEEKYDVTSLPAVWLYYLWRILKGSVRLLGRK